MRNINFAKKTVPVLVFLLLFTGGAVFADEDVFTDEAAIADEAAFTDEAAFADGAAFANEDGENLFPKNTITFEPPIFFILYDIIYFSTSDGYNPSSVFGIAARYERQFTESLSAVGRLEYGMRDVSNWNAFAFSAEGRFRYYPSRSSFFLEGMFGYANIILNDIFDNRAENSTVHYFKFGGEAGWRFDFGDPGGFVLEPAIGFNGVAGKKLESGYGDDDPLLGIFSSVQNNPAVVRMLLTGVRFTLGFGYRF
jgi:hypothetical protein